VNTAAGQVRHVDTASAKLYVWLVDVRKVSCACGDARARAWGRRRCWCGWGTSTTASRAAATRSCPPSGASCSRATRPRCSSCWRRCAALLPAWGAARLGLQGVEPVRLVLFGLFRGGRDGQHRKELVNHPNPMPLIFRTRILGVPAGRAAPGDRRRPGPPLPARCQ
jgi:hypothetical protein